MGGGGSRNAQRVRVQGIGEKMGVTSQSTSCFGTVVVRKKRNIIFSSKKAVYRRLYVVYGVKGQGTNKNTYFSQLA